MQTRLVPIDHPEGTRRMAVHVWPARGTEAGDLPPVVCVHGLTRNGRDFDPLAEALSAKRTVYAVDVLGRGESDWLADPAHYQNPQYAADMIQVMGVLDLGQVDWVGTSMGGLIGMILGAAPDTPIRRMVLNDVGPVIPGAFLERVATYVGRDPVFEDLAAVEAHIRQVHAPFGPMTDADWRALAETSARVRPDGTLGLAYDPKIAVPFTDSEPETIRIWELWDAVVPPVLILRGAESDLLSADIATVMTTRGPGAAGRAHLHEVAGAGHTPALRDGDTIATVSAFLRDPDAVRGATP